MKLSVRSGELYTDEQERELYDRAKRGLQWFDGFKDARISTPRRVEIWLRAIADASHLHVPYTDGFQGILGELEKQIRTLQRQERNAQRMRDKRREAK